MMRLGPAHSDRTRQNRWVWVVVLAAVVALAVFLVPDLHDAARGVVAPYADTLELDVQSDYSRIQVRRQGNVRTMVFIRDSGEHALETQMDLTQPHELQFNYLRYMFLSYAFRPQQQRVLIVGLGGGSMVHFLRRYDPQVHIDAVEIDPVVVRIADEYFGTRSGKKVNIITADAFQYLAETESKYDVIYMDAFLKPSRDTDSTGAPLHLRTLRFYQDIQKKLSPEGLVVFNLNPHTAVNDDVKTIAAAFPQTYVFRLRGFQGMVVVGSMSRERVPFLTISNQARDLDRRFKAGFSFEILARQLVR